MPEYPPAHRLDLAEALPAHRPIAEVADPYRWLEDADDIDSAAWLAGQQELFAQFRQTWPLRGHFESRVRELLDVGYTGPPIVRGGRVFFSRRLPGAEHGQLLVREPAADAPDGADTERVLLDPMALDPSGATTLDAYQPSKEGNLLAYQLSSGGTEESSLRVLDVATGATVDGPIDRTRYSPVAWLRGERAFYYVRRLPAEQVPDGEQQYHRRVYLHRIGQPADTDVEIFGAGRAKTSYYGVSVSWDGRWLTLSAAQGTDPRNDVWLADLSAGGAESPELVDVAVGLDARTGAAVGRDGRLYVSTDLDAPRGRLAVTDPSCPQPEHWRDLLAERRDAVLEDYLLLDGGELASAPVLLASWTRHAVSQVTVHEPATGTQTGQVELPGVGTIGGLIGRPEGGDEAWLVYTDYARPPHVYRLGGAGLDLTVFATPPGTAVTPDIATRQVQVSSKDGTTVRMFVLTRADRDPDAGPAPAILYGYGGFGHTMTPGYSASILAWVEAGGIYAVAGLRGGGEEGEQWHRDGMLGAKQNVFDDFHACAQALVEDGWTSPARLGISGGSNGGLLVGAAATQWPHLFAAVACSAPLLDMVRYHLHGLGVSWTGEYGDPASPQDLGWLLGYSPYHRVVEQTRYPATLFTVFGGDTRVDPLHASKLCAALQHATAAPPEVAPILLRREADVGHGARALSKSVALTGDTLGFLARYTGLDAIAATTLEAATAQHGTADGDTPGQRR